MAKALHATPRHAPSPSAAGCWAELEVDTLQGSSRAEGETLLWLSHLRSYAGMGAARAECRSGCTCSPATLEGAWEQRVSLFYMTRFPVGRPRGRHALLKHAGGGPAREGRLPFSLDFA